jgi:hypothetical protein
VGKIQAFEREGVDGCGKQPGYCLHRHSTSLAKPPAYNRTARTPVNSPAACLVSNMGMNLKRDCVYCKHREAWRPIFDACAAARVLSPTGGHQADAGSKLFRIRHLSVRESRFTVMLFARLSR